MMEKKRFSRLASCALAAVLGLALMPFSANAFLVTSAGQEFTVDWTLEAGATDPNGNTNGYAYDLTGEATFLITSFSGSDIGFLLTLSNTTVPNSDEVGLNKFAFGTEPDAAVVSWLNIDTVTDTDDKIIDVRVADTDPGPPNDDNLNKAAGGSNSVTVIDVVSETAGGKSSTLQSGQSDAFTVLLSFAGGTLRGVEFSPFAVKYQSDPDSFQFPGNDCVDGEPGCGGGGITNVPAPGTLALALLGLGALLGRKRFLKPA